MRFIAFFVCFLHFYRFLRAFVLRVGRRSFNARVSSARHEFCNPLIRNPLWFISRLQLTNPCCIAILSLFISVYPKWHQDLSHLQSVDRVTIATFALAFESSSSLTSRASRQTRFHMLANIQRYFLSRYFFAIGKKLFGKTRVFTLRMTHKINDKLF